ncbi:MAG TPA: hypothetical protein PKD85_20260, partial [Saprospiraceae bacterium]|nr:hypothetical protein [Saprospiraceae bacterium]
GINDASDLELLSKSPIIKNQVWKKYIFYIKPRSNIKAIVLKAYYYLDKPSYGNLQIDSLSDIYEVSCSENDMMELNNLKKSKF